ncbi:MAG TPA: CHAD domain-containing protein [Bacteroidales bacterium]|nr:CHAD domain-containing protein [Bacteroidales bacterium]HPF02538.1 CHAD domain-containing protein [Bacteroidales bacterium]HPJ58353.1 CHAD domain-containing protein [Bacteroidales bacterium]HPR10841.1 CHAD domain-containing protein [Bacteroidales bacterium]HRW84199.1 CHAD domain-containing protein [Bacteroidales bacterium]
MVYQNYIKLLEVKPALTGYLREAHEMLDPFAVTGDKAVHDVRVLMKKSRAVLRLISDQTDDVFFKRNYEACREVGRLLASHRDSSVYRKTLKDLKKDHGRLFASLKDNEHLAALSVNKDVSKEQLPAVKNDLAAARELIGKAGYRLRFQNLQNVDPRMLLASLDETYKTVVQRYMVARNKPRPGNIHLFRKKAKDLLYQLWIFRPLNTSAVKSLEKKLDTMTRNLGKYNDLAQLLKILEYKQPGKVDNIYNDQLILVIRDAQDRYLSKVWPVAFKIFTPGKKLVSLLKFKILIT